jgi:hypothetical protein
LGLVDKILKYKEINFSVSSDYIIPLKLCVYLAEYTSKTCRILWQEYVDICVDIKYIKTWWQRGCKNG